MAPTEQPPPWTAVDRLVDRAAGVDGLLQHRLGAFAARRRRALGAPVEPELAAVERAAALAAATAPSALQRVLAAAGGRPVAVVGGTEAAARYPEPGLRPLRRLELVTEEPRALAAELVKHGWERAGSGPRVMRPGLPLEVALHAAVPWLGGAAGPGAGELLASAATGPEPGLLQLPAGSQAVLAAVGAWRRAPLRRVLDLLDVVVLSEGEDPARLRALAAGWGVARVWDATMAAADAVLAGAPPPWTLRVWARSLAPVRPRTPAEYALEHWLSPFAALPPREARRAGARALARDLRLGRRGGRWR